MGFVPSGPPLADRQAGVADQATRLRGVSVLVVDDDADTRDVIKAILEAAGAEVHLAASAREGLRRFVLLRPAVLLADLSMPGEDGYWLISRVRALASERARPTPAVAMSGRLDRGQPERVLAAGFQAFLPKPFGPEQVLAAIAGLLTPAPQAPGDTRPVSAWRASSTAS